ncbi:Glutamine synthetase [compost metagenome]
MNAEAAAVQANIEFRAADALSSPYIVLGALLAAGIDGIQRSLVMPKLVGINPCLIPKDEHPRYGLKALPSSLGDALKELDNDTYLKAAMGTSLLSCYRAVKQSEIQETVDKDDFAIRDMYSAVY